MTIKELCNKYEHCYDCSFVACCPYNDYWDIPLNKINDEDNKQVTNAIIKTAEILTPTKIGHWLRMSDLSEMEDDRYKCSNCGNVVHHRNKMNLYTFNRWCGRCGSDNGESGVNNG